MQEPNRNTSSTPFKSVAAIAVGVIVVVGILAAFFGYRVGKNMAIRDNQKVQSKSVQ